MNFIVSSSPLLKHCTSIQGALASSNTMPILDNFLFEIKDGILTICASDNETTMKTQLGVQSEDNGKIAVPARLLLDALKTFPDQPLTFSVDENNKIEIASDDGRYQLIGQNGDEYPRTPVIQNPATVKLGGDILASAISKTLFATSNDEIRPIMTGVFCEFTPDDITFVATDAHKLVRYRRTDSSSTAASSFILPKKPLNLLKSTLSGDEEIQIEYNESNVVFKFNDVELTSRLIDGKYPNYEAVIPKENPNKLTVDRAQLLSALKRVSIFANKSTHQVRLSMAGSELTLSAEDLDFANAANERLTCSYEGEDMEIGFNSKFLIEMLNNVSSKEVLVEMSQPGRAGIIFPTEKEQEEEDLLMLVMPVMLKN